MTLSACPREKEVIDLLARGHWPQACPADLRAHVDSCRSCAEHAFVTQAFQQARADASAAANLASPGVLWWRAQLRRRNAAVERVGKPILGAQIFALAVALVVSVVFVISQATHGLRWMSWFEELQPSQPLHIQTLWQSGVLSSGWSLMILIPALATVVLLGGAIIYFASEKQ
jgi:hypothetical protein